MTKGDRMPDIAVTTVAATPVGTTTNAVDIPAPAAAGCQYGWWMQKTETVRAGAPRGYGVAATAGSGVATRGRSV